MNQSKSPLPAKYELSKRAWSLLSDLKHQDKECKRSAFYSNRIFWNFSTSGLALIKSSDKILTLFFSIGDKDDKNESDLLLKLMSEVYARMLLGAKIETILTLGFREVESYLRDENHLPSFQEMDVAEVKSAFNEVKTSLLSAFILKAYANNFESEVDGLVWTELSLVEKNSLFKRLTFIINVLFFPEKPLELILAEASVVTFDLHESPMEESLLDALIHSLLAGRLKNSSLKVVAVR